jgi:large subunit ribosomal protein L30
VADKLRVTLVRSLVSHTARTRSTVRALGLHRIGQTVEVDDTPEMRGMTRAVRFLLTTEEIGGSRAPAPARAAPAASTAAPKAEPAVAEPAVAASTPKSAAAKTTAAKTAARKPAATAKTETEAPAARQARPKKQQEDKS